MVYQNEGARTVQTHGKNSEIMKKGDAKMKCVFIIKNGHHAFRTLNVYAQKLCERNLIKTAFRI